MKLFKRENGAISIIVITTLLFFAIILSGTYLLNTTVRKSQIKSQIQLRDEYAELIDDSAARNQIKSNYNDFVLKKYSSLNADFTVNSEENPYSTYIVKEKGKYKIECWGASSGWHRGIGAYVTGNIILDSGDILYIYVGGRGARDGISAYIGDKKEGYNGGGKITNPWTGDNNNDGGGGATDVRIVSSQYWYGSESLNSRIMVAGGGGGYVTWGPANYSHGGQVFLATEAITGFNNTNASGASLTSGNAKGAGADGTRASGGGGFYGGCVNSYAGGNYAGTGGSSFVLTSSYASYSTVTGYRFDTANGGKYGTTGYVPNPLNVKPDGTIINPLQSRDNEYGTNANLEFNGNGFARITFLEKIN